MERIIRDAIVTHMSVNNLFSKVQHGYIRGRSCTTQLWEFIEDICEALDNGEEIGVVYLDFCKAFDKVPHLHLLKKISAYVIQGKVYGWIKDILTNRVQRMAVNGSESDWSDVTSGIPQRSVLGPIPFLIYINDLPDVMDVLMKLFCR